MMSMNMCHLVCLDALDNTPKSYSLLGRHRREFEGMVRLISSGSTQHQRISELRADDLHCHRESSGGERAWNRGGRLLREVERIRKWRPLPPAAHRGPGRNFVIDG